jgi:hypothetical protein
MDKLRILPVAFVFASLSSPAFAQLTTIGPDTPGVTEFLITGPLVGPCESGSCFLHPTIVPVSPGTAPFGFDPLGVASSCINGCSLPADEVAEANNLGFDLLKVDFSTPVNTVVALQMQSGNINGAIVSPILTGGGASCLGPGVAFSAPPPCFQVTQENAVLGSFIGDLTISAPNITSVLIGVEGGSDIASSGTGVQFSVTSVGAPEPATLGLMFLGLAGVGFAVRKRRTLWC